MTAMKRILFVDDEVQVLEGLRDNLRKHRRQWAMVFVSSAQAALTEMEKEPFDIVVSDMQMPGTDGAALLGLVRERCPRTVRLILSGQANRDTILRAIPLAHQFLSKPCDPLVLRTTLERLCALQDLVDDDSIRSMVGELGALPSLPRTVAELGHAIECTDVSSQRIAEIVERDPPLAAKVLQLTNSAFFGLPTQTNTVEAAIKYLGVELLTALTQGAHAFVASDQAKNGAELADALQQRAISVARLAKRLAPDPKNAELAFTAGLLHNLGMMVLALQAPECAKRIVSASVGARKPWHVVEAEVTGPGYALIGAYLLGIWGLPLELVEAVAYQHAPNAAPARCPLELMATIHVATTLVESMSLGADEPLAGVDVAFAARAGILEKLPTYLNIARQDLSSARGI